MPRTMERIVPIKNNKDALNCYATIQRAAIAATTACLRVGDASMAKIFSDLRMAAIKKYDKMFEDCLDDIEYDKKKKDK